MYVKYIIWNRYLIYMGKKYDDIIKKLNYGMSQSKI